MTNACDIFDYYRTADVLCEDDYANFLVIVQDDATPEDGLMAVAGLTLSLLEGQWNEERMLLLLKAFPLSVSDEMSERIVVGVLLLMMKYNMLIRDDSRLWDPLQEVLTANPELSFTALCNIARTSQVKFLENFNQQMAKDIMPLMNQVGSDEFYDAIRKHQGEMERIARLHLDQNFLIFKSAYQVPFFQERAAHWFKPWNEEQWINVAEEDREHLQELVRVWPMCDSDKYALINMPIHMLDMLKGQIQPDMVHAAGDKLGPANIIANGYVQQLYRYFRLSSFSSGAPFDLVAYLRDAWVYRLVVVGEGAKRAINQLLP